MNNCSPLLTVPEFSAPSVSAMGKVRSWNFGCRIQELRQE